MNPSRPNRAAIAGGFLLALSIMIGTVGGALFGEPSIGFLAGAATGIALSLLVWLLDSGR
jgi:hypothetical protein